MMIVVVIVAVVVIVVDIVAADADAPGGEPAVRPTSWSIRDRTDRLGTRGGHPPLKVDAAPWSLMLGTSSYFYKGGPISAPRPVYFLDHKFVAGIHATHVNFLVGENDDDSVLHIDGHLLLLIDRSICKFFESLKKRLSAPSRGVAWIDVNRDQIALHTQEHFAFVGTPLRTQRR